MRNFIVARYPIIYNFTMFLWQSLTRFLALTCIQFYARAGRRASLGNIQMEVIFRAE